MCDRWQPGGVGRGRIDNSGNLGKGTQGKLGRQRLSGPTGGSLLEPYPATTRRA